MSNCLVISANGFIGSHLVDALAEAGHTVTAFDRFSSGMPTYQARGVAQFVGDFLSRSDLNDALKGQEYAFHFLSTTSPATADDEPTLDLRTNVSQSVEFFQLCVENRVAKVYFASTGGAIYGDQGLQRYSEAEAARPVSPYGIGKLTLEHYLGYFHKKHGLESVSLKISNPYGPRQHPHRKQGLIPLTLQRVLDGQPVIRFGKGSMIRDYIQVQDAAAMIADLAGRPAEHGRYNIGSGVGHSVAEVLSMIETVVDRRLDILQIDTPRTFIEHVVLDTTRYDAEFGNHRRTSLLDGISVTWREMNHSNRQASRY